MTLQQTVNVTKDRLVHLPVPDGVPVGMTEITITFTPYKTRQNTSAKRTISLEKAAEMAVEDYRNDKELTAFCALDGEDFYETR